MIAMVGIEAIGDDARARAKLRGAPPPLRSFGFGRAGAAIRAMIRYEERPRAWVARIVGPCPRFGLAREFLSFNRDYAEANSLGSRGVYQWYELEEGGVFEVNAPLSWKHADRYFCRSERGKVVRMTRDEVDARRCRRAVLGRLGLETA